MKFILIILATLLLLPLGASATEPMTLRYNFPVGAEIPYQVQTATVSRSRGFTGAEQEISGRITQTACYRLLSTTPEGEMAWEQAVLSGSVVIRAGEETRENDLPKGKLGFKLSPLGKITLLPQEGEQTANLSGFSGNTGELDMLLAGIFLPLPQKAVKPGDRWQAEIPISFSPLEGAAPASPEARSLKVKSELLAFTALEGKACAKIRTDLSLPFSHTLARPGGLSLNITGNLTATIEWYCELPQARTLSATGTLQIITEMAPAQGYPEDFRSRVSIKSNIKTTRPE